METDLEALAELRRSIAEVPADEHYGSRVSAWNRHDHRTRTDAVRLYDVMIARVAGAGWPPAAPRDSQHAEHLRSPPRDRDPAA